jgi:hypothetical protein
MLVTFIIAWLYYIDVLLFVLFPELGINEGHLKVKGGRSVGWTSTTTVVVVVAAAESDYNRRITHKNELGCG